MKITALMIMLSISINSFAQNATLIEKGEIAPFSGTLITNERVDKLVKAEKKVLTLEALGLTQDELIAFHKEDATAARKKLSEAKFDSYVYVMGAFVVGVLVTGFAFKVNQKIGDM